MKVVLLVTLAIVMILALNVEYSYAQNDSELDGNCSGFWFLFWCIEESKFVEITEPELDEVVGPRSEVLRFEYWENENLRDEYNVKGNMSYAYDNDRKILQIYDNAKDTSLERQTNEVIIPERPPITISTDKRSYSTGETIFISGEVSQRLPENQVSLHIIAPVRDGAMDGNIVAIDQIHVDDENRFTTILDAGGPSWGINGEYTVKALYGLNRVAQTTFIYESRDISINQINDILTINSEYTLWIEDLGYFLIDYSITGGSIASITAHGEATTLIVAIDATDDGQISLTLPRGVIDAKRSGCQGGDTNFYVLVDGEEIEFGETKTPTDRTLVMPFFAGSNNIEIIGTCVVTGPNEVTESESYRVAIPEGGGVPGCEVYGDCYEPSYITINVGETVTWSNDGVVLHTITAGDLLGNTDLIGTSYPNGFDSGYTITAGKTFSHKFDVTGEYPYYCVVHPWMTGIVLVY